MKHFYSGWRAWLFWLLLLVFLPVGAASGAGQGGDDSSPASVGSVSGQDGGAIEKLPPISVVPFPAEIQRIKDQGKLVVAMFHHDRPPFFYIDGQGNLVGLEVEMAGDIARWLGVEVEFNRESRSFDAVVDMVVTGRADVGISKLSMTLSRALRAAYTDPYLVFHHALLINRLQLAELRKKNPGKSILELLEAAPHKIGVRGASAWVAYAEQSFPKARIIAAEDINSLVATAARGEVLAILYDEYEIKEFINERPGLNIDLQLLVLHDRIDPIGIAVAPEDRHLLAWLNHYLGTGTGALRIEALRREYGAARSRPELTGARK